jgi:arylsulfatase A-like enzyme
MTENGKRRRNILLITTDQMWYDSLQCNGGKVARTPVANKLAAEGINYRRANNQNVVCTPARSSMITGQYVRTHGVYANGVPLPEDAPSIAGHLQAHFQPALADDPHKWHNPWIDPKHAAIRSDLIEDLYANLPDQRSPLLKVEAPR